MEIIISNSSSVPIYEQIKEQIKNQIISDELQAGELLPSIRSLARDLNISVITTKNAYMELEKEGYVKTIPAKGIYVAEKNMEMLKEEQLKKMEEHLEQAISLALLNKLSKEEFFSMIDILYEEEK